MLCVLCTVSAVLAAVPTGASGSEERETRVVLLPEARAIVDANRLPKLEVSGCQLQRFRELLYHFPDLSDETADLLCVPDKSHMSNSDADSGPDGWEVSPDHAAEEVERLFNALRFGYAGYQFFGGDVAFGAAKEAILREIAELASYCDTIPNWRYADAVVKYLGFVQDSHLVFGNRRLCERMRFRFSPHYEFTLSADGSYRDLGGRRIVAVNNEAPSEYLKPSINVDGEIVYILGVLSSEQHQATLLELQFEGGTSEMAWLIPADEVQHDNEKAYELTEFEGLPMAMSRTFRVSPETSDDLNAFVRDAETLRQKDAVLLDVRWNPGGSTQYGQEFCRRLAMTDPRRSIMTANLLTDTALVLRMNQQADANGRADWLARVKEERHNLMDPELPGWSISVSPGKYVQDTPLILVLMNGNTASAAEALIRCLRSMDGVVLIGTNTGGALLTGNAGLLRLTYSGIVVGIPTMIWMDVEMRNLDGVGYFPDFWVHPDAAETAAAFVRKYVVKQPVSQH